MTRKDPRSARVPIGCGLRHVQFRSYRVICAIRWELIVDRVLAGIAGLGVSEGSGEEPVGDACR